MFCRPLDDTMAVECRLGGRYVPLLIHKCAEFIRKHGRCVRVCPQHGGCVGVWVSAICCVWGCVCNMLCVGVCLQHGV